MVTINVRQKGANAERELAGIMMAWASEIGITLDLIRNLEQVRSGGHDLLGIPGIATEVKRVEVLAINTWWGQCVTQATVEGLRLGVGEHGIIPLLAYRQSRKPWIFMTRAWVWPCKGMPLVITMSAEDTRIWFHAHLVAMVEQGKLNVGAVG
jgi:hypothetical protein